MTDIRKDLTERLGSLMLVNVEQAAVIRELEEKIAALTAPKPEVVDDDTVTIFPGSNFTPQAQST